VRRTTQWAVFTSMNRQQPVGPSLYEAAERASSADGAAGPGNPAAAQPDSESRTAVHNRRDRVDFM
jgi:hypothetical protein